jgi:hypothetical protein
LPKDLGSFHILVAGWEQVGTQSRSPVRDVFSPISPTSSYITDTTNIPQYLPSPTSSASISKSAALKEQFLRDSSPTPTTPQSNSSRTPTTPTYSGSGYRFAGVERLAQRQKIYEPQTSPDSRKENVTVSTVCYDRLCKGWLHMAKIFSFTLFLSLAPILHFVH